MNSPMEPVQVVNHLPAGHLERSLREDVRRGLTGAPKTLPPKWFYDKRGSELFEEITRLPEYYPTRAEREVLQRHASDMAAAASGTTSLVELGSGSSAKTTLLLDALIACGGLRRYVAVDVSESALAEAAVMLHERYPDLRLQAVVADFESQLRLLPQEGRRMVAFLGGTIGNLEPAPRSRFLGDVAALLGDAGGSVLLGTDLVKSPDVLVPAYDDPGGVTASFNRNVLRVLNRELGADFDVDAFDHVAVWDPEREWIEMRLRATRAMTVHVPAVDLTVTFGEGEEMRTEVSAKFHPQGVVAELAAVGLRTVGQWTDAEGRYAVTLAVAESG
jgi:L-histidine N-alpha-methyltransferase